MTVFLTILVFVAYLIGAYFVFKLNEDEEVDVFDNITYQKLCFFFGLMIILFFSLLIGKVLGWEE